MDVWAPHAKMALWNFWELVLVIKCDAKFKVSVKKFWYKKVNVRIQL